MNLSMILLVLCAVRNTELKHGDRSLCKALVTPQTGCPIPVQTNYNMICYKENYTSKDNGNHALEIQMCSNWLNIKFTTIRGATCIQGTKKLPALQENKNLNLTLHEACQQGLLEVVLHKLSNSPSQINTREKRGLTPVMVAARYGHKDIFDFLVQRGCNLSLSDYRKDNVIHHACVGGNVDIVRSLVLDHKIDVDSRGRTGLTPIMRTVVSGNKAIFDFLVSQGCNLLAVRLQDNKQNLLHMASMGTSVYITDYILSRKIFGIDSTDRMRRTPIIVASYFGRVEICKYLVSKGCDLLARSSNGLNSLHVACMRGWDRVVEVILDSGKVDINIRGSYNRTPIMYASEFGFVKVFDVLLKAGSDITLVDMYKNNILHFASSQGQMNVTKRIVFNQLLDINCRGRHGRTSLMMSVDNYHVEIYDYLVSFGSNTTALDDEGYNVLHLACANGHTRTLKHILANLPVDINSRSLNQRTCLLIAAEHGHTLVFQLVVRRGGDVKSVNRNGANALHLACEGGHLSMVKYIQIRSVVTINSRDKFMRTPIMFAAKHGKLEVMRYLLRRKCNASAVDYRNNNILHIASSRGHLNIVTYVIARNKKSYVDVKGFQGKTAVMFAAENNHVDILKYLYSRGCNFSEVDEKGNGIIHNAALKDRAAILDMLLTLNLSDTDSLGQHGRTAAMFAAERGHIEVFKVLLLHQCGVYVQDNEGNTLLHIACLKDKVQFVEFVAKQPFWKKLAKMRNKLGVSPLFIANGSGNKKLVDIFKRSFG